MKFNNINSQNFQSQAVPEASEIKVNNISLEPIPFVTLTKNEFKSGPYTIGGNLQVDLQGFIYGSSFNQTATGIANLEAIRNASVSKGFVDNINIKCGSTELLKNGVGVIESLNFDQGPQRNWMNVIPYNMSIIVYESGQTPAPAVTPHTGLASKFKLWTGSTDATTTARGISNIQETFSFEFDNDLYYEPYDDGSDGTAGLASVGGKHLKVNFNLSVEGATSLYLHDDLYGVQGLNHVLEKRVRAYLQTDFRDEVLFGNFSLPSNYNTQAYLRKMSYNINEIGNQAGVQGELIFLPTANTHKCLLTMNVDHTNSIESAEKTITINGKAIGLHTNVEGILELSGMAADSVDGDGLLDHVTNNGNAVAMGNAELAIKTLFGDNGSLAEIQDTAFLTNIKTQFFMESSGNYGGGSATAGIGKAGYLEAGSVDGNPRINDPDTNPYSQRNTNIGTQCNLYMVVSKSLKRDYSNNSIDFSIKYSNKRFRIAGALWAEINVDHEKPATKIIEHVTPGRGYPIVQDLQCTNLESYTITCTAQKEPQVNAYNTITTGADTLIEKMAQQLGCNTWAKVADSCSYGNSGSYRRTVKYTRNFIPSS